MIAKGASVCLLGLASNLVTGSPTPRAATQYSLVALGDSYTSAVGAGHRVADDNHCRQFDGSYFNVLQADPALSYSQDKTKSKNLACAGAKFNVIQSQITDNADLVAQADTLVMTAGGNDIGFFDILNNCIYGWLRLDSCEDTMTKAEGKIRDPALKTSLVNLYNKALGHDGSRTPNAKQQLFVLGYPEFFNDDVASCTPPNYFQGGSVAIRKGQKAQQFTLTPALRKRIDSAIGELNGVIADAAKQAIANYVDPNPQFNGHRLCDPGPTNLAPWFFNGVNDLVAPASQRLMMARQAAARSAPVANTTTNGTTSSAGGNQNGDLLQTELNKTPPGASVDPTFFYEDSGHQGNPGQGKTFAGWLTDTIVPDALVSVFHPTSNGQNGMAQAAKQEILTNRDILRIHGCFGPNGCGP